MIRFMGFATGAAAAIVVMLFLFGVPEVPPAEPAVAASAPTSTGRDTGVLDPINPPTVDAVDDAAAATTEPEPALAAAGIAPESIGDTLQALAEAAPLVPPPATSPTDDPVDPEPQIAIAADAAPRDMQWHAFWSPFRSQIAANGFVQRLELVTGFDYRVIQLDTGVYEVAVGYANDDERRDKLAAIAQATGLDMPES